MKLEELMWNLLTEQEINADLDHHDIDPPEEQNQEYLSPFHTNEYKRIKQKWVTEFPNLSEIQMDNVIELFNRRKTNLRPYRENINADGVLDRGVPNQPEVTSLKLAFPDFPAENIQKLKDLNSYNWIEIEFFTDRFNTEDNTAEIIFNTEGDTEKQRLENAYNLWKGNWPSKIIDENGLIVHKISGRDEAIAFGKLQHMINRKINDNYNDWCITSATEGSTWYNNYRDRRSYYFTLKIGDRDTEKESDKYYMSVIQPSTSTHEAPYVITPRPNGDEVRKTWEDVVRIYPQLEGKQDMFRYFPKTNKEKYETVLDSVNFNRGDRNHFIMQPRIIQNRYIESGRNIGSLDAFKVFNKEQLSSYIQGTNINNYKLRFISSNHSKPFEILDFLKKEIPGKYNDLNNYIIGRLEIPSGVKSIKYFILLKNFIEKYINVKNKEQRIVYNELAGNFGVYNNTIKDFILFPVFILLGSRSYFRTTYDQKFNMNVKHEYTLSKYVIGEDFYNTVSDDEERPFTDTFYTLYDNENLDKKGDPFKYTFVFGLNPQSTQKEIEQGNIMWNNAHN